MLWYKAWRETRLGLLISLGFLGFVLITLYSFRTPVNGVVVMAITFVMVIYTMLAGIGIRTQPSFRATKGLHGSTLFTLSLPVTRFRLLAIRAGLGWLEMAGGIGVMCVGVWLVSSVVRARVTAAEIFGYAGTLTACASALYFLSVLLATFLAVRWRMTVGYIAFGTLWWLSNHTPLPASLDIVRAMGDGSPLVRPHFAVDRDGLLAGAVRHPVLRGPAELIGAPLRPAHT
jgi:ABC-2 type transport system permease protein